MRTSISCQRPLRHCIVVAKTLSHKVREHACVRNWQFFCSPQIISFLFITVSCPQVFESQMCRFGSLDRVDTGSRVQNTFDKNHFWRNMPETRCQDLCRKLDTQIHTDKSASADTHTAHISCTKKASQRPISFHPQYNTDRRGEVVIAIFPFFLFIFILVTNNTE